MKKESSNRQSNNKGMYTIEDIIVELNSTIDSILDMSIDRKIQKLSDQMKVVDSGVSVIVNIINNMNTYIMDHLDDLQGIDYLTCALQNLNVSVSGVVQNFNASQIDKNIDKLANHIVSIVSGMRYLSAYISQNSQEINDSFDSLMGDTDSYQFMNRKNRSLKDLPSNNSILFRYFLINKVIDTIINSSSQLGFWKDFVFYNLILKWKIWKMVKAVKRFAKAGRSLKKITGDSDRDFGEMSNNILNSFVTFQTVLNGLSQRKLSLVGVMKMKYSVWKLMNVYKYFIKKLVKISKEAQGAIDAELLVPLNDVIASVFQTVSMLDVFRRIGWIKLWMTLRKIKKTLKDLVMTPYQILSNIDSEQLKQIGEFLITIKDLYIGLFNTIALFNVIKIKGSTKKNINKSIDIIMSTAMKLSTLSESVDDDLDTKLRSIQDSFETLSKIIQTSLKIAIVGAISAKLLPIAIEGLLKTIELIKSLEFSDADKEKVQSVINNINLIIETETKAMKSLAMFAVLSVPALVGVIMVTIVVTLLFAAFKMLSRFINKKQKKRVDLVLGIITQIVNVLSAAMTVLTTMAVFSITAMLGVALSLTVMSLLVFGYVGLAKVSLKFEQTISKAQKPLGMIVASLSSIVGILLTLSKIAALNVIVITVFIVMWMLVGQYIGISKIVTKFKSSIQSAGKLLLEIGGSMVSITLALQQMKGLDTTVLTSILLFGAVILEMIAICFLINLVKRPAKKGIKTILWLCLGIATIFATVIILSTLAGAFATAAGIVLLVILGFVVAAGVLFFVVNLFKRAIIHGILVTILMCLTMMVIAWSIGQIYQLIGPINWEAMLFFYGNIIAMFAAVLVIGKLITANAQLLLAAIVGDIAMLVMAWTFAKVGKYMGQMYKSIGQVNWEAMGFFFANLGAMAAAAAAVGLAICCTAGIGAAAIGTGVATLIGITYSFTFIAKNIKKMYSYLPSSGKQAQEKTDAMLAPLYALSKWVAATRWKDILWLPKGASALKKAAPNLADAIRIISRVQVSAKSSKSFAELVKSITNFSKIKTNKFASNASIAQGVVLSVNSLNLAKMTAFTEMWRQAAAFSKSISGNFDKLAETLADKLAPILKELKDTIEQADKHIQNAAAKTQQIKQATTESQPSTTAPIQPENKPTPATKPNNIPVTTQQKPKPSPANRLIVKGRSVDDSYRTDGYLMVKMVK